MATISRVADHCFWLSRYLERAENIARILEVNQSLLLDTQLPAEKQWMPLMIISGIHDYKGTFESEAVQEFMTWDIDNKTSIQFSVNAARENARIIREVISSDMWERLNFYYLWMQDTAGRYLYNQNRHDFYNQMKRINHMFHGITDATMSHGEPWQFLQMGKYLERASQTARILDVKYHVLLPSTEDVGMPIDNANWMGILTSCSGYEPFHKQYDSRDMLMSTAVADFLIFDPIFPRSVRNSLHMFQTALHAISGNPVREPKNDPERLTAELLMWLDSSQIDKLVEVGLHESLTRVVDTIGDLGAKIHETYIDVRMPDVMPT